MITRSLLAMLSLLAFVAPVLARAGATDVRPTSMIEQLDHCKTLLEIEKDAVSLGPCFTQAARILHDGIRHSHATSQRSLEFEQELERGATKIAVRLEELSLDDEETLHGELRAIDDAIRELRVRLSQLAAADGTQLSLVSRGGASLGNWQAGFLFSVTEWAKSGRKKVDGKIASTPAFSTVTGASAGAVNGFAATIEGCKSPNFSASDSLYYQVWINLGLFGRQGTPGLFPGEQGGSSPLALFTGDALEATLEKAREYAEGGGMLPSCSVDFGFVTTHLDPKEAPVHVRSDGSPILTTRKLKEKFSVRVSFAGTSESSSGTNPLSITNIGPSGSAAGDQIYYAGLGHEKDVSLRSLMMAVRASGAFPGAFPPVSLDYTQYVPGPDNTVLPQYRTATFIDGGILDNTPVGLAVALDSWRAKPRIRDPHFDGLLPAEPRTYVFLEPLVRSWMSGRKKQDEDREADKQLLQTYLGFTGDLLATTVDAQLSDTAEQFSFVRHERRDWAEPRLSVPVRHMPITGAQFNHFMAFLERDFRIFDFYVGMADAHVYLERESCLSSGQSATCEPDRRLSALDAALKEANPKYSCIRAYYQSGMANEARRIGADELPSECELPRDSACEAFADAGSEKSVREYLASGVVLSEGEDDSCVGKSIARQNFRVLLVGMHNLKAWMLSDDYSKGAELDHFFDEISTGNLNERFVYVDLSIYMGRDDGYLDADAVKKVFRALVHESIVRIASEQEGLGKYFIQMGGRALADAAYGRYYPKRIVGVGIVETGFEVIFGQRIGNSKLRWDSTFRYFNLGQHFFSNNLNPFTSDFYFSTQATWVTSPTGFLDVEIGAGWAAVETIAYNSWRPGHVAFRTGPRSYLALVALQRIYLALNVDYYPYQVLDVVYGSLGRGSIEDWTWNLAVGWRFLY